MGKQYKKTVKQKAPKPRQNDSVKVVKQEESVADDSVVKQEEQILLKQEEMLEEAVKAEPAKKEKAEPAKKEKDKKKGKEKKKEKKQNRLARKTREIASELKKVTWPTFPKVVRQTGVVLAVVVFFTLILFGIDKLLEYLFRLLMGS